MGIPITRGRIESAKKIITYGPEGIGKSTLASKFPDPVFIDTEGSTKELDVARYPTPEYWDMIIQEAEDLLEERNFKTLVIDTADWAEKLCIQATCDRLNVKGIEDIGYGKGYVYLAEDFQRLLTVCDKLVANGINVVFTAHAMMRKFEQPDELGAYDRWEMKLSKKVAPLLKEWADVVLFCNYKTTVVSDPKTKSKKATGGSRVMYSTHHPCWDAKNRYGLPDDMDLDFEPLRAIYEGTVPARKDPTMLNVDTPTEVPVEGDIREDVRDVLIRRLADAGVSEDSFESWLIGTGRLAEGGTVADLSGSAAKSMLDHIDVLLKQLKGE